MSNEVAQLACTYAALILYDDGQDITGDKIATLVKAAGVNVESYWPKLFAKAVEGQDITTFFNFGASSGSSAQPAATQAVVKEAPKQEAKKQAPKPKQQPKEEQQDGGMGGLFD